MSHQLIQQSAQFDKIAWCPEHYMQNSTGERGVLETVLRTGASLSFCNNLTKIARCPKHHKQE